MTRYVIIGNSAAGIAAVEGIRELDADGQVTVITEEGPLAYGRPLISYWLENRIGDGSLSFRDELFYRRNCVELVTGIRAVRIDSAARRVILSDGREVHYDRLLIATGARPFVPSVDGLEEGAFHTFMTIEDVRRIASELGDTPSQKSALIVGAGLTGMKAAEALHNLGVKVLVIDLAERVLIRILDDCGSSLVCDLLTQKGLQFRLSTTLEQVKRSPSGSGHSIRLTDGSEHEFDIIVVSIGVRANVELVREAGGEVNRGVVVDAYMRTSLPDVFAAGDVAESPNLITQEVGLSQIMPNASIQGRVAGRNMAGGDDVYEGNRSFNSLPLFGIPIVTVGVIDPSGWPESGEFEIRTRLDAAAGVYRKVVLRHGRLVGAVFVNSLDGTGIVRHLIEDVPGFTLGDDLVERILAGEVGLLDLPDEIRIEKLSS